MYGRIVGFQLCGLLERPGRFRIVLQPLQRISQLEVRSSIPIVNRERLFEQLARAGRIDRLSIHRLRLQEISGRLRGVSRGVRRKSVRDFGQSRGNLIQKSPQKRVRLLDFGSDCDCAQERRGGVIESPQSIAGYAERKLYLGAVLQMVRSVLKNRQRAAKIALLQQRLRQLEIKLFRALPGCGVLWVV